VRIASLGARAGPETRPVKSVSLVGASERLRWKQQCDALVIELPASLPTAIASSVGIGF
jgi:alpha-L-fucosidase